MSDLSDLVCLAHDHGDREQEAICSARFQIAALRSQLTTAERERDEVRRELAVLRDTVLVERQAIEQLRHRAERAARVVEAAKAWDDAWFIASVKDHGVGPTPLQRCTRELHALSEAVRALDAAEGK